MGAMYPPSVFNQRGWYQAVAGWLKEQNAKYAAQGHAAPAPHHELVRVMLHRAFRVWLHLAACRERAAAAGEELAKIEIGPHESLDGVAVWSPNVEAAIVSLVAAFADLHVLQNDTASVIIQASAGATVLPESMRKAAEAIERAINKAGKPPAWLERLPAEDRGLLRGYWRGPGNLLTNWRNLDQHSGVLARAAVFRQGPEGPGVLIRLPDNPEDRGRRKPLTFDRNLDGLEVAESTFSALRQLADAFAVGHGAAPTALDLNIEMLPSIDVAGRPPGILFAYAEGGQHLTMRSV